MKHTTLVLGALLSVPLSALAADPDNNQKNTGVTPLETVVITADKMPQTLKNTLAPMIVISREEIARSQAADLAGLLRFHAGLNIAQTGGPGQTATLFLRGTESNHVLVLIDGVAINPGTVGGAPFAQIDPDMIERIEIVKGPRSALYGSEAIGGVINIITRKGADGINATAHVGGGSFGTIEAGAAFRYGDKDTRAGVSINHDRTDGFPPKVGSDIETGSDNTTLNANLAQEFGSHTLAFRHWQASGTTHYLDFLLNEAGYEFEQRTSAIELTSDYSARWSSTLSLSQAHNEIQDNGSADYSLTERQVLDWQHSVMVSDRHLISGGLYFANENIEVNSFGSVYQPELETRAIYVQDDMRWNAQQLELALRYSDHNIFGSHTSWNAAWGLSISDDTRISLAAGSAYRAPDATDLYGFGGNLALQPETARNIEAGVRHVISNAMVLNINVYQNDIEDLITYDFTAGQVQNIDSASIKGVETILRWQTTNWRLNLEASYQEPMNTTSDTQLLRRSETRFAASLVRDFGALSLGADFLAVGPRKDYDPATFGVGTNPGYGLLNLTAAYEFNHHWTLRARLENVTDKQYSTVLGYNAADRSIFLTLSYSMQ